MVQEIRVNFYPTTTPQTRTSHHSHHYCFTTFSLSPIYSPLIQTLDGEMQKLVYDNYNKFITATETIKEMKTDVYGMDPDMEAVR